jgi:SPOR domain
MTNTPLTDIWHLSIDDLLAPLPETARLGGPGPFVINLSASTAPMDLPKGIAGCRDAQMYQVQRMEDRRPRYRLRLGPFADEDEAEAVLEKVREFYPGALTATADADDLRAIASLRAKSEVPQASVEKPAPPPVSVAPRARATPPVAATPMAAQKIPVLRAPAAIPTLSTPAFQAEPLGRSLASLETTQTVRALTQPELEDDNASRWFVIQLSVADEAFDPDTVPNLDIFSVYRLYSVAGIDQGRIMHALRLGFFTEEIAAGAVASYLTDFYDKPTIKRVSAAERQRFADEQSLAPRKDVGATGRHAVIEITSERFVREKRNGASAK